MVHNQPLGTDNIVASEKPGQYQHVTTLSDISQPDLALVKKLDNVQILESEDWAADSKEMYVRISPIN